jgi:hypothetical protein
MRVYIAVCPLVRDGGGSSPPMSHAASAGCAPPGNAWTASFTLFVARIPLPQRGLRVGVTVRPLCGAGRVALALDCASAAGAAAERATLVLGAPSSRASHPAQ